MKFRSAIITSLLFHLALVLVAFFYPEATGAHETTYYVDLVHVGGSPPGSSKDSVKNGDETRGRAPYKTPRPSTSRHH